MFCFVIGLVVASCVRSVASAKVRNVTEIVESYGYSAEFHTVTTADKYVLGMQRILPTAGLSAARGAVLLQHGLLDSGYTWVANLPSQSLGYLLADAGYDVWLGNVRGNTYSLNNLQYNTSTVEFWNFSWDEMVSQVCCFSVFFNLSLLRSLFTSLFCQDFPSFVSYILKTTGRATISYVGHSQGGIMGFGGLVVSPALQKSINVLITLAPAVYLQHCASPGAQNVSQLPTDDIYQLLGHKALLQSTPSLETTLSTTCTAAPGKCVEQICTVAGCESPSNYNYSAIPQLVRHFPAGTSTKDMGHFQQQIRQQLFQMYDYGSPEQNQAAYGQPSPPLYDLSRISPSLPSFVFYGGNDLLVVPTDVHFLLSQLPSSTQSQLIPSYGHGDFVWGLDAASVLYTNVISIINSHSS